MTINLSGNREEFVRSLVSGGRFASEDEVIDEALRLLRQREEAKQARILEGIRQGIDDMNAGRSRPAEDVFEEIRREFNLSPDA